MNQISYKHCQTQMEFQHQPIAPGTMYLIMDTGRIMMDTFDGRRIDMSGSKIGEEIDSIAFNQIETLFKSDVENS